MLILCWLAFDIFGLECCLHPLKLCSNYTAGFRGEGDVVLDSFQMAFRDEDDILDQTYEKKVSLNVLYKVLNFY